MEKQIEMSIVPKDGVRIKSIIEALLFVNEKPIEVKEFVEILDISKHEVETVMQELSVEYHERHSGMCIVPLAGGYQMCSSPENEEWIKKMYRERRKHRLSLPALETLAIIAYKQPITKMEMETLRGVNIDGVLKHLSDLGLIKFGGRKEVVGRPFLYITTRKFLEYFGLNSLADLPKLEDFLTLGEKTNNSVREVKEEIIENTIEISGNNEETKIEDNSVLDNDGIKTEEQNNKQEEEVKP